MKVPVGPADKTDAEGAKALLAGLAPGLPALGAALGRWRLQAAVCRVGDRDLGLASRGGAAPTAGLRVVWVAPGQEPPVLPTGFRVLKRRWVVERTFAWLGRNRRLSKDYEALPASAEAWIYVASCRLLLRRLAR